MHPEDLAVRRQAVTTREANLVVSAGAGTGKTSLLVERVLVAVGSGRVELERLAAITFTEKAAGELRERIASGLESLWRLCEGAPATTQDSEAERAWAALGPDPRLAARVVRNLEALDAARVTTIHGFCAEVLREFAFEAGVDPGFAVDAGEHFENAFRTTWEQFAAQELGPEAGRSGLWRELLGRLELADVEALARSVADFGVPLASLRPESETLEPPPALREEADALHRELSSLLARASGLSPVPRRFLGSALGLLDSLRTAGFDAMRRELAGAPDFSGRLERSAPKANKTARGATREEIDATIGRVRAFFRGASRVDENLCRLALSAVAPFVAPFRERFLRAGHVTFDGLLHLTRALLAENRSVRRRLQARFDLILVDEFQDTDPVQYEIVLFLGQTLDDPIDDPWQATLAPGRLFVVGDAKQSIYRFRGADHDAYARAVARLVETGGVALELTTSFRSRPEVLAPVHRVFEDPGTRWRPGTHQPRYVPVRAHPPPAGEPRVELWTIAAPAGARIEVRREAEGRVLADEIARTVREDGVAFRDVTILLRAFTHVGAYLRPLRERGIPFVVDGGREFLERPEVQQLLGSLRALVRPDDASALLAYLRAPTGAVPDSELARFARSGGRLHFRRHVDAERFPALARALETLRGIEARVRGLPADAVMRRLIAETHMMPLQAAAYEGAQRVANLQKLVSAAGELARDGRLGLDELIDALSEGRLEDLETDRPLADDRAEAVRITSIHRMKGLENRVVFLADLSRGAGHTGSGAPPARHVRLGRTERLAIDLGGSCNHAALARSIDEPRHDEAEELRVLYVALTRARERLVLTTRDDAREHATVSAFETWGYRTDDVPADGARLAEGDVLHRHVIPPDRRDLHALPAPPDLDGPLDRYLRAADRLRRAAPPAPRPATDLDELRAAPGMAPAPDALDVGREVHRALERFPEPPGFVPSPQAAAVLDGFASSDLARILASVPPELREVPILIDEGGIRTRGRIDVVFREDGRLFVADYKTDRSDDLTLLRARYGARLALYARAVAAALDLDGPVEAEIWDLRRGRRISLSG